MPMHYITKFFDLFCVFSNDAVRNVCGPLQRVQIYSYLDGLKNRVLGHFQAEGGVGPKLLLKVV